MRMVFILLCLAGFLFGQNGQKLYYKCMICHGDKAQKKALGKSAIINTWSEEQIYKALIGYKNGTYGGRYKGSMIAQAKSLSDEQLKLLSKYISKLKK